MSKNPDVSEANWPALPLDAWRQTYATLHMWTQIVGKVRLALTPLVNHWWNVTLHVTSRGLGTGAMPCGSRAIEIDFDFVEHNLIITSSDGQRKMMPLVARPVADFYNEFMTSLESIGASVRIWPMPVEVNDPIRFTEDRQHASYDPQYVACFWQILRQTEQVFEEFRARFIGKCSPVHFFWGAFDMAVTRFNGRPSAPRSGADAIAREDQSHEHISHGFWPGGVSGGHEVASPIFYSYTSPEPPGIRDEPVRPATARFDQQLSEFILSYDDVRNSPSPRQTLMEFLQSTYEAGAKCAKWDRAALER